MSGKREASVLIAGAVYAAGYAALAWLFAATLHGPSLGLLGALLALPPLLTLAGGALAREARRSRASPFWAPFVASALILGGGFPALASAFLLLFFAPSAAWLVAAPGAALVVTIAWWTATVAWFVALAASIPAPTRPPTEFELVRRRDAEEA